MKFIREPVNSLTHLAGAALSLVGLVLLMVKGFKQGICMGMIISLIIFGLSLILLYSASGIYHWVKNKQWIPILKKVDHAMIFVLIAGTYTPILYGSLTGWLRLAMLILIWGIAIGGVFFKIFWIHAPRWLYTGIYLGMGWISVFLLGHILKTSGWSGLSLLLAGGISYSVGAVIYGLKKPNFSKHFGFHEFFHCFVLGGSILHFLMIYTQIL